MSRITEPNCRNSSIQVCINLSYQSKAQKRWDRRQPKRQQKTPGKQLQNIFLGLQNITQWTRKFKKFLAQKLVKSKSISQKKNSDQIPCFAITKMAKNQFLNWEKG